jgi:hypothetical protein
MVDLESRDYLNRKKRGKLTSITAGVFLLTSVSGYKAPGINAENSGRKIGQSCWKKIRSKER